MPSAPVPPHDTKLNSTVTGTLPAKLNALLRARPFSVPPVSVSRSHPEPAASIDGAVKMAELLKVHPDAVVPLKSCCSLNCAVAGMTYAVKSKQLKESLVRWTLKSIFMDGYRSIARRSRLMNRCHCGKALHANSG